jgi:hypothetical protein
MNLDLRPGPVYPTRRRPGRFPGQTESELDTKSPRSGLSQKSDLELTNLADLVYNVQIYKNVTNTV